MVVELEPDPQQQAALEDPGRHGRVADGAEQDRVVLAQFAEHRVRQQFAGAVPAGGPEVVFGGHHARHDAPQDLEAFGNHLWTDAITGDDRELHRRPLYRAVRGGRPWRATWLVCTRNVCTRVGWYSFGKLV